MGGDFCMECAARVGANERHTINDCVRALRARAEASEAEVARLRAALVEACDYADGALDGLDTECAMDPDDVADQRRHIARWRAVAEGTALGRPSPQAAAAPCAHRYIGKGDGAACPTCAAADRKDGA